MTNSEQEHDASDVVDAMATSARSIGAFADGHEPWGAHAWTEPPRSRDRILLATALVQLCTGEWGLDGREVAAAALDSTNHSANAERVRIAMNSLGRLLFEGRVQSWARQFGGGEPVALPPSAWELDDFERRMATSAIDPARPFDPTAMPTHWVFLSEPDWEEALARLWGGGEAPATEGSTRKARVEVGPARAEDIGVAAAVDSRPGGERFLRLPEVLRRTAFSRATLYRRIAGEEFPEGRSLGGNVTAWPESEVDAWIASRS